MRIHAEGVKDVKKMERKVKEVSEREKVKKEFYKTGSNGLLGSPR
jgi:hypothetical protein